MQRENVVAPAPEWVVRWQPPEEGVVKCNIDAALFHDQQKFGIDMCFRGAQ
ncbi:hypothetical protein A2U01_0029269, partial [Trifolium medium]|nr:hypothetical protein [Trifolium medium]